MNEEREAVLQEFRGFKMANGGTGAPGELEKQFNSLYKPGSTVSFKNNTFGKGQEFLTEIDPDGLVLKENHFRK